jgi:hypothetical protein
VVNRTAWTIMGWLVLSGAAAAQSSQFDPRHQPRPVDGQALQSTGYVLPQGNVELGILFAGYGITDWLTVGLQPIYWVAAPVLGGVSVNAAVKLGVPIGDYLNVALEVNPLWLKVQIDGNDIRGILLPITLATSLHPDTIQHYSLAVRYSSAEGFNETEIASRQVAGNAVTRLVQLIGQMQFQVMRGVGLYVQGLLQLWDQALRLEGSGAIGDRTRVRIDGVASSVDQALPWAALAGVHLSWRALNLRLGAGYGNIFVPRIGLTSRRYEGVIPDLDLFVRF